MQNNKITLVETPKKKKWINLLAVMGLVATIAIIGYYISVQFSVEDIQVSGNTTYSSGEVIRAVQESEYVPNTLVMVAKSRIFKRNYLPFIEEVTMSLEKSHVLHIRVREGLRAGVFTYVGKNVYFDSEGRAQESRKKLFEGVPVVTGVNYDKLVLGEQIPVDADYFDKILAITKQIAAYSIPVNEIHFNDSNDITLKCNSFDIHLGGTDSLDLKMSKIMPIVERLEAEGHKGLIDMHLLTDEKDTITFVEEK